jgi:hypothetical protein
MVHNPMHEEKHMTHQVIARMVGGTLALAIAIFAGTVGSADEVQARGRYKKQGDKCVWDASDSGPNQCTPQTKGRFKKTGATCAWDSRDTGADQCRPSTGRFKKEGTSCVWNAKDSGPDQCDPRTPR